MPISSIRPDNSTKSGKNKKLQSTVLPGGTAPTPGAYLDGIVKSEPGLACPSPIRSQAKLMPKVETANMILTLSNGKMKIIFIIFVNYICFSEQVDQKRSERLRKDV